MFEFLANILAFTFERTAALAVFVIGVVVDQGARKLRRLVAQLFRLAL